MNFTDFSKEARLKEEARINDLTKNVVAKATKMALDKFSKAYGLTTKVAAQKTDLKEFKRNYLSGKIASVLSIDTKDGVKNVPFTILVKASEPSIFESDVIMEDKIANTKGSLESEIEAIMAKQNQKLANYEIEEESNKKIISDLAKGVSLEASRKAHIFKEAKKEVGHNSLSTVTTPTNIFNKVVDYFTYPKTFFPAMKVGAIVDIAGVKYKYIGDEATMTEPAGNTNGTIARFELANKKKASLNKESNKEGLTKCDWCGDENEDNELENTELGKLCYRCKKGIESKEGPIKGASAKQELPKRAMDDFAVFKLHNLFNDYYHNGLISEVEEIEGKKVVTGSPEVINELEHKIKDLGYYCDTVDQATGVEGEEPIWALRVFDGGKFASVKKTLKIIAKTNFDNYDFTDENLLNLTFDELKGHPKYKSLNAVQAAIAHEFGLIGGASSLTNIRKRLIEQGKTTVRDLYEKIKNSSARNKVAPKTETGEDEEVTPSVLKGLTEEEKKEKLTEDDKLDILGLSDSDAKEFFTNDTYVEENIKNFGIGPKDSAYFLDNRYEYNNGLPENKVNDLLVDSVCDDPEEAFTALSFLLGLGTGAITDDLKIADKYKYALFQAAAKGNPDKNLKEFPVELVEKYAVTEETTRKRIDENDPIATYKDGTKVITEEKVREAIRGKSPEEIANYCKTYNVVEVIKNELDELKKEINSYSKELRAEVGTTFEDEEEIDVEESLKTNSISVKAEDEKDELEEGFEEELEKQKKEFEGSDIVEDKDVSQAIKEVEEKEIKTPTGEETEEFEDTEADEKAKESGANDAVATELDSLRATYTRYKTLKNLLEKLEDAISKANKEETK